MPPRFSNRCCHARDRRRRLPESPKVQGNIDCVEQCGDSPPPSFPTAHARVMSTGWIAGPPVYKRSWPTGAGMGPRRGSIMIMCRSFTQSVPRTAALPFRGGPSGDSGELGEQQHVNHTLPVKSSALGRAVTPLNHIGRPIAVVGRDRNDRVL